MNAPAALLSNGSIFTHVANTYDAVLNITTWKIGQSASSGVISDIVTVDWAPKISGLYSVFSGTWFIEGGNGDICSTMPTKCHLFIPASITDISHFSVYETHAINWPPTVASDFSDPVSISLDEGDTYDPQVTLIGSTYFMWFTLGTGSNEHWINLASSSSLLGPYTTIYASNSLGWGNRKEGPIMYSTGATSWRLAIEDIDPCYTAGSCKNNQIKYSDCNTLDISVCTWTALQSWTEDIRYRHGSIIKNR